MSTRVVIEAGHGGGIDPGAVVNGVAEADINRAVAQRLCAKSDDLVQYDCKRRGAGGLAALLSALRRNPPDVVVSLHCDSSASDPRLHRASVYHWSQDPNAARCASSTLLARWIVAQFTKAGASEHAEERNAPYPRGGKDFLPGILRVGKHASVLVEMGYLSDQHVRQSLVTATWQEKAADAIDAAVRGFLNG
jgi:N-acetylmuramoyl-L-alanine amidase